MGKKGNKLASAGRVLALFAIFAASVVLLFAGTEGGGGRWLAAFMVTKAMSFGGFMLLGRLYRRWSITDEWIKAHDRRAEETA